MGNFKPLLLGILSPLLTIQSPKEQKALEAIASIVVIGGVQLRRLFNLDKSRVKRMVARKMIVRHEIKKGSQSIPIYTIGKTGANKIMPKYIENYWVEYNAEEVLKRLVFFQLCYIFNDAKVLPAPSPFVGTLSRNRNNFYVYVTRGKVDDLMMFLKWRSFSERIIIVTESFNFLKPLEVFIKSSQLKIRATTDEHLKLREALFYRFSGDKWVLEK